MSAAKHTPGPWAVSEARGSSESVSITWSVDSQNRVCIATAQAQEHLREHGIHEEECRANAHLIAAAPELLAALKMAESVYRHNVVKEGEPSSVLDAMQRAIAKATGGAA